MYMKAANPEFWTKMRDDEAYAPLLDCVKREYAASDKRTTIKYSEFISYLRTGVREGSDIPYFDREAYFNALIFLSLIYPENEDYLAELQDVIWDICNDFTWERASHVKALENLEFKPIALTGATMAAKMVQINLWFGDRFDIAIKNRIAYEIKQKYLIPFQENTYRWETMESNWACTCAGYLGIALMLEFPEEFLKVKPRIDNAMECFLSSFSQEGFCLEGVGY